MSNESKVLAQLQQQSAIHGVFAEAFAANGGTTWLTEWAKESPGQFFRLFATMSPGLQPTTGMQGDVNIVINNHLGQTALDGEIEDAQFEEIEDSHNILAEKTNGVISEIVEDKKLVMDDLADAFE